MSSASSPVSLRSPLPVLSIVGLILLSIAVHGSAIHGWWLSDDPQVLVQAVRQSPSEYFFDPPAWRYLSSSNFTPLVTLSFELDHAIGGLDPRVFYLHQVGSLTLAAVLLFLLLAPHTGAIPATLGAALFIVSPQAVLAARTLMVRHYVEGLALAIVALLLWGQRRVGSALAAAVAYLLAMLAKEVFVPLPLLMLLASRLTGESWRKLLVRLAPVGGVFAIYMGWRLRMLGSAGGYGNETLPGPSLLRNVWNVAMAGSPPLLAAGVAVAIAMLFMLALLKRPGGAIAFGVTAGLASMVPLIPIASQLEARHGFFLFALLSAGVSLAIRASAWKVAAGVTSVTALAICLAAGGVARRSYEADSQATVAEGKFIWSGRADGPVLLGSAPSWYLAGLAELRRGAGLGAAPRYILSPEGLAVEPLDLQGVVAASGGRVGPLAPSTVASTLAMRSRYVEDLPLLVKSSRIGNRLRWEVGPPPAQRWIFLTYPEYDQYTIPPSGARMIPQTSSAQFFRVWRELADGRWSVTPPLPLPVAGRSVAYRRD